MDELLYSSECCGVSKEDVLALTHCINLISSHSTSLFNLKHCDKCFDSELSLKTPRKMITSIYSFARLLAELFNLDLVFEPP